MARIGIVGGGIAGLTLALRLQALGEEFVLYAPETPAEVRAGPIQNAVVRFAHTQERERALGVDHWPEPRAWAVHVEVNGEEPFRFAGRHERPSSFVDMRLYLARLQEDLIERGGRVVRRRLAPGDLADLGHRLVVVASGRGGLAAMFPADPVRSPYDRPQRVLCCGLFEGVAPAEPDGVTIAISPGHGEVLSIPMLGPAGPATALGIEAIPGGDLEAVPRLAREASAEDLSAVLRRVLRAHAPGIHERVDAGRLRLTRREDLLVGGVRPIVRRNLVELDERRIAIAIGDAHVVNDPILGQGANAASHAAWTLAEEIAGGGPLDAGLARRVEERIWAEHLGAATEWTNAALAPPERWVVDVLVAAACDRAVADAYVSGFDAPSSVWPSLRTPEGAAAFLARHATLAAAGPSR